MAGVGGRVRAQSTQSFIRTLKGPDGREHHTWPGSCPPAAFAALLHAA